MVPAHVFSEVQSRLAAVERRLNVSVLFACESGSRAWGFPSTNSDYDVRFIYVRPVESYLTVRPRRDVIEVPIEDEYDLSGWDLQKALFLLYKSNPALLEWISCPIVYAESAPRFAPFRQLSARSFNPLAAFHHYRSMAKQHIARICTGETVRLKHYLYALRPLLACQWILEHNSQPPMLFAELVDSMTGVQKIRTEIDALVKLKAAHDEVKAVSPIPAVMAFIQESVAELDAALVAVPDRPDPQDFDEVFRTILQWPQA